MGATFGFLAELGGEFVIRGVERHVGAQCPGEGELVVGDVDRGDMEAHRLRILYGDMAEAADARGVVDAFGAAALCRVLLNCNEFLFTP